jgi:hypothetical protein
MAQASFSPRRNGFNPRPVRMDFVVDKRHWDRFFCQYFSFPLSIIPPVFHAHLLIYHRCCIFSITGDIFRQHTTVSQEIPNLMEHKDVHSTHGNVSLEPILSQQNNFRRSLFQRDLNIHPSLRYVGIVACSKLGWLFNLFNFFVCNL